MHPGYIGTGQWDAGWPGNDVTPFNVYEETLKTVMSLVNIQLFPPSMHVFYRSVCIFQTVSEFHSFLYYIIIVSTTFSFRLVRKATYNWRQNRTLSSKRWRSPNVIDVYKEITKRAAKHGMRFDTSDIMGKMRDQAFDFSHYQDISMEIIYFVRMVLSTNIMISRLQINRLERK